MFFFEFTQNVTYILRVLTEKQMNEKDLIYRKMPKKIQFAFRISILNFF